MKTAYELFMTPVDPVMQGASWVPTYNSTSDVWNLKNASGQILFTVTINYTDSTKATIQSVVRS